LPENENHARGTGRQNSARNPNQRQRDSTMGHSPKQKRDTGGQANEGDDTETQADPKPSQQLRREINSSACFSSVPANVTKSFPAGNVLAHFRQPLSN
jgi:hypothetical protein